MKCLNCGANLGLEDKFCPYCGTANPFAKQHQAEMQRYQAEFEKTKETVEKKANRLAGIAVPLTVLGVAIFLLIVSFVFRVSAYDIGRAMRSKQLAAKGEELRAQIEESLDNGDYGFVYELYNVKDLNYLTSSYGKYHILKDYELIFSACRNYEEAYSSIADFSSQRAYRFSPDRIRDTCRYLAEELHNVYSIEDKTWYDESCYTPEKLEQIHTLQEQMSAVLITYAFFTPEEVAQIPDQSEGKLEDILVEKFSGSGTEKEGSGGL